MIGARLTEALRCKGWTKKEFTVIIAAQKKGGQSGTTYQTILAYFSGASEPSIDWIRSAARILNVKPSWIAFGIPYFAAPKWRERVEFIAARGAAPELSNFDMRTRVGLVEGSVRRLSRESERANAGATEAFRRVSNIERYLVDECGWIIDGS